MTIATIARAGLDVQFRDKRALFSDDFDGMQIIHVDEERRLCDVVNRKANEFTRILRGVPFEDVTPCALADFREQQLQLLCEVQDFASTCPYVHDGYPFERVGALVRDVPFKKDFYVPDQKAVHLRCTADAKTLVFYAQGHLFGFVACDGVVDKATCARLDIAPGDPLTKCRVPRHCCVRRADGRFSVFHVRFPRYELDLLRLLYLAATDVGVRCVAKLLDGFVLFGNPNAGVDAEGFVVACTTKMWAATPSLISSRALNDDVVNILLTVQIMFSAFPHLARHVSTGEAVPFGVPFRVAAVDDTCAGPLALVRTWCVILTLMELSMLGARPLTRQLVEGVMAEDVFDELLWRSDPAWLREFEFDKASFKKVFDVVLYVSRSMASTDIAFYPHEHGVMFRTSRDIHRMFLPKCQRALADVVEQMHALARHEVDREFTADFDDLNRRMNAAYERPSLSKEERERICEDLVVADDACADSRVKKAASRRKRGAARRSARPKPPPVVDGGGVAGSEDEFEDASEDESTPRATVGVAQEPAREGVCSVNALAKEVVDGAMRAAMATASTAAVREGCTFLQAVLCGAVEDTSCAPAGDAAEPPVPPRSPASPAPLAATASVDEDACDADQSEADGASSSAVTEDACDAVADPVEADGALSAAAVTVEASRLRGPVDAAERLHAPFCPGPQDTVADMRSRIKEVFAGTVHYYLTELSYRYEVGAGFGSLKHIASQKSISNLIYIADGEVPSVVDALREHLRGMDDFEVDGERVRVRVAGVDK